MSGRCGFAFCPLPAVREGYCDAHDDPIDELGGHIPPSTVAHSASRIAARGTSTRNRRMNAKQAMTWIDERRVMTRLLTLLTILSILTTTCADEPRYTSEERQRIESAARLEERAKAIYPDWRVFVSAHGRTCSVLILHFKGKFLEQRDVDSLHYVGRISRPALRVEGCPEVLPARESALLYEGGVYAFAKEHHFRGTVYLDGPPEERRVFGDVRVDETIKMEACHGV